MRRRSHRHPAVEIAVFAAALLLAAFIGRELWQRRAAPPVPAPSGMPVPVALNPSYPPLPSAATPSRTETAISAVAPIKLTRLRRRPAKSVVVPVPK